MPRNPWAPAPVNSDRSTMPCRSQRSLWGTTSFSMNRRTLSRNSSCSSVNSVRRTGRRYRAPADVRSAHDGGRVADEGDGKSGRGHDRGEGPRRSGRARHAAQAGPGAATIAAARDAAAGRARRRAPRVRQPGLPRRDDRDDRPGLRHPAPDRLRDLRRQGRAVRRRARRRRRAGLRPALRQLRRVRRHAAARVPPPQLHRGVRPVRAGPRRGHAPAQRRAQRGPAAPGPLRGPPAAAARRRRAHPVALGGAGRPGRRRRRGRRAPRLPHGRGPGAPAGQRPDLGPRGADRPAHRVHLRRHRPALVAGPRRAGRRGPPPPPRGGRGVTARRVAVVVAGGGPPAVTREQLGDLGDRPVVVAADEGLQHAEALGLRGDLVVGDMDSVDPGALAAADAAGVPLQRHPAAKDATDLELALDAALAAEVDRVVVVTGTGDRLDHTMAVALTVSAPDRVAAAAVEAWIGPAHVWVVAGEASLAGRPGELLSLLPAHGPAVGVTTSGLLYPLADEDLPAGIGRGVSNEWVEEVATVRVRSGILLAVAPGAADGARAPR